MSSIKEVVSRIHSIHSTQQITKAMKMVAASKLAKVQHQLCHLRPYSAKLNHILTNVSAHNLAKSQTVYTQQRPVKKLLLVIMSADKGLCGSFNTNVFKKSLIHINQWSDLEPSQIDLCIIGKKAANFFQNKPYHCIVGYSHLSNNQLKFLPASHAAEFILRAFIDHAYDRVELLYNRFISAASQVVEVEQFLPIKIDYLEEQQGTEYIYEPSRAELLEVLLPKYLKIKFYKALLESQASEQGARMTTMSKATDNAEDMLKSLRIRYNRSRQASITNEILEIVAGAEALK